MNFNLLCASIINYNSGVTNPPVEDFTPIAGQFTQIYSNADLGWADFSDGGNQTQLIDGALFLDDSNSTVDTQTKCRTLLYNPLPSAFKTDLYLMFPYLNDSTVMDTLGDTDNDIDGYTVTSNVGDAAGGNQSGLSFIAVHPTVNSRVVFLIFKATDYDTTGNCEIWKVNQGMPILNNYVNFTRIWVGNDIPIGEQFKITCEYEWYQTTGDRPCAYVTIKDYTGKILVNREIMGHTSNTGGNGALAFQCKGTADDPVAFYIYDVTAPEAIPAKTYPYTVVNTAIQSGQTANILSNLSSIQSQNGDAHFIMLGSHDILNSVSVSTFKSNLTTIVQGLSGDIILLTFPRFDEDQLSYVNADLEPYVEAIREISNEQSTHLVDINAAMAAVGQPTVKGSSFVQNMENYGSSGSVNLTYLGNEFVAEQVAQYLKQNNLKNYSKLVCVGDSITRGYANIGEGTANGQTWPARLKAKYELI